jgi:hypothetical protein
MRGTWQEWKGVGVGPLSGYENGTRCEYSTHLNVMCLRVGSVTGKIVIMNPYTIFISIKSPLNIAFYSLSCVFMYI